MSIVAKNLARLVNERGEEMKSLSVRAGLGETAVRDIIKGRSRKPSIETVARIAAALHVDLTELTKQALPDGVSRGMANKNSKNTSAGLPKRRANMIIEIDVRGGMGGGGEAPLTVTSDAHGTTTMVDDVVGNWSFPGSYLNAELRVKSDAARIIEVQGDSMEPTLSSGDRVMINTADTRPSPPGIFALWDGFGVVVKRIEHIPNSNPPTIRIKSDNPHHGEYQRTLDEVNIIGRLVWYARRL